MPTAKCTEQSDFYNLTDSAVSVFDIHYNEFKGRFPDCSVCFLEYTEQDGDEGMLEIRFNKMQATLSCPLDVNKKCRLVYLFMDNCLCEADYIQYVNKNFVYDSRLNRWIISDCFMSIKRIDGITCFVFHPILQ